MGDQKNNNLYAQLYQRFSAHLDRVCMETPGGRCYTYGDVHRNTGRIAARLLELGLAPGDRMAVQVEKSPESILLYLACLRAGAVYLPLNPAYPPRELHHFLSDAEPRVVVCSPPALESMTSLGKANGAAQVLCLGTDGKGSVLPEALSAGGQDTLGQDTLGDSAENEFKTLHRDPDDLAALLYTSGTTGQPKGAMLTHRNLGSNAETLHQAWGFDPEDVLLHALPLFHTHGLFVACHTSMFNATPMILLSRFDVKTVLEHLPRATVFMGVPTFYTRLLAASEFGAGHCQRARLFVSGSAPLLESTFEDFRSRTGHTILERYGMTECGMSTSNPLHRERRPGTVGFPLPGVHLRVVNGEGKALRVGEVGGIEFKGPNLFRGYWRAAEKTAQEFTADGYFRSGDLGSMDQDGYLRISGRSKDLIITGGYNVYPKEVERCLDQLTGVNESAVIGLPDPDFGERVTAVVVLNQSAAPPAVEVLIAHLKTELASYKVPKSIEFVDELPRNAMGKVQKNVLRERFS